MNDGSMFIAMQSSTCTLRAIRSLGFYSYFHKAWFSIPPKYKVICVFTLINDTNEELTYSSLC